MAGHSVLDKTHFSRKTRYAVVWKSLLSEPLWVVYNLLVFILYKDLHATVFHVSVLTMLKPIVAIFSLYWSIRILDRQDLLRYNVVWAGFLGRMPFFFFPFINDPWLIIFCAAFYMMLKRGEMPAWMEIIKLNIPKNHREKVFSLSSAFAYLEGIFLTFGVGFLLDRNPHIWRVLFPIGASFGICAVLIQSRLPINSIPLNHTLPVITRGSFKDIFIGPWKEAVRLMRKRPDFRFFQWGFMVGGFALMIIMPTLPIFVVDTLGVTYTDLAIAIGICKGLGFALSSPFWARMIHNVSIFRITSAIVTFFGLFPVFIIMGQYGMTWFYSAYFLYGVAQGGSHLYWHMSGPIFAHNDDSSLYSSVNIFMVGLRGCVGPPLGAVLCVVVGPLAVLSISALLSFFAAYRLFFYHARLPAQREVEI